MYNINTYVCKFEYIIEMSDITHKTALQFGYFISKKPILNSNTCM